MAIILTGGMVIAMGPAAASKMYDQSDIVEQHIRLELPESIGVWTVRNGSHDNWEPVYHGAINLKRIYHKGNDSIVLYVGYYAFQKQGEEIINDLNKIANEANWKLVYPIARHVTGENYAVLEQMLEKRSGEKRLVWYWYDVAGRSTTDKYKAKLLQVVGLLNGKPQAKVIAASVEVNGKIEDAQETLREFVPIAGDAVTMAITNDV